MLSTQSARLRYGDDCTFRLVLDALRVMPLVFVYDKRCDRVYIRTPFEERQDLRQKLETACRSSSLFDAVEVGFNKTSG